MRQHLNDNKKVDGPLGIRPTVWLVVFGLVLVCMLIISQHQTEQSTREIAVEGIREQNSPLHSWPRIHRTAQREVRPESYEDPVGHGDVEIDLSMVEQMVQDRRTWMDDSDF
jgi:hypothetical protein